MNNKEGVHGAQQVCRSASLLLLLTSRKISADEIFGRLVKFLHPVWVELRQIAVSEKAVKAAIGALGLCKIMRMSQFSFASAAVHIPLKILNATTRNPLVIPRAEHCEHHVVAALRREMMRKVTFPSTAKNNHLRVSLCRAMHKSTSAGRRESACTSKQSICVHR